MHSVHTQDNYAPDSLQLLHVYWYKVCSARSIHVRAIINQIIIGTLIVVLAPETRASPRMYLTVQGLQPIAAEMCWDVRMFNF